MLINLLIAFFEKTTKKTSKNSSKPPSQTEKDEFALINEAANGKGKPESSATANNTSAMEAVSTINVDECDVCGCDLSQTPCEYIERRTKSTSFLKKSDMLLIGSRGQATGRRGSSGQANGKIDSKGIISPMKKIMKYCQFIFFVIVYIVHNKTDIVA